LIVQNIYENIKSTATNSVFILFGQKTVWEVHRFLVALYRVDEDVVPIPQTKQTRGTLGLIVKRPSDIQILK